ncbi:hypothetical protein POTOM_048070 [Populus tomentosa]|uniref:NTF2-like domain-containing protein n=1 Tax=Populus tomentosa TaxID=118781 RepID=A0A8X7YC05_POPTO|nr:hypothetical protein POTOM_048070 [Populus tomentosa]
MALFINSPEISTAKILFNRNPNPNPRNVKSLNVRVRARSDVRVSGLNQNVRLYGQFSAPVKQETKMTNEEEEKQNYYVNMGYAIRTLREEFPGLFYRELSFDIYRRYNARGHIDTQTHGKAGMRDDIVYKDPINTFGGIESYKSMFWALRFHGRIFFRALWVDIISVSQPAENVIVVRWTVHGIPRVPWESCARFDGLSEYKLDSKGKIFQHRADNIALNSPPKFHVLTVEELIQSFGCPSTPKPTYFEVSPSLLKTN